MRCMLSRYGGKKKTRKISKFLETRSFDPYYKIAPRHQLQQPSFSSIYHQWTTLAKAWMSSSSSKQEKWPTPDLYCPRPSTSITKEHKPYPPGRSRKVSKANGPNIFGLIPRRSFSCTRKTFLSNPLYIKLSR